MEKADEFTLAKNGAYFLLRARPRSEYEMRSRLKLKGFSEEAIEKVLEVLKRSGEIDDRKFASLLVDSRMHMNPVGDILLRRELKDKGIAEDIITDVLNKKKSEYDESEIAFNIARQRYKCMSAIDSRKALKRLYDHLLRRGFKFDIVKEVIDRVLKVKDEDG